MLAKFHRVKATVFPVVMHRCESWTIKKTECRRIDAFELQCWRRLDSSLDCKEINPSNPKGNQPWIFTGRIDAEAEAPILWLPDVKNWLKGKDWSLERLRAGGERGNREWEGWMASPTQLTWVWANYRNSEEQGSLAHCNLWGWTQLSNNNIT